MSIEKIIATLPNRSPAERKAMREKADLHLASGEAQKVADAEKLIAALDDLEQSEHAELVGELKGMPVGERIVKAFTVEPMTETEAKVIQVLLDHPGTTNRDLSRALGWNDNGWDLHFGTMCSNREVYLWPAEDAQSPNGKFFSGILADYDEETSLFTMKPDVVAAFAQLGLKGKS